MQNEVFTNLLVEKGRELYRDMPWRNDTRPYYILVSEVMLQQTQVSRVIPKFTAFITRFPDEKALATAPLADVLELWQGLGYNRRAKFLHDAAKHIVTLGSFPTDEQGLRSLPGVGTNTAGAILAYAYNQPALFIETNVRTVYIHHFFDDLGAVDDKVVKEMLAQTIDTESPREFYWALMDYGSWLKAQGVRNNAMSRHYVKQSPLEGSVRQVRGQIIKKLTEQPSIEREALERLYRDDPRFVAAFDGLLRDQLIAQTGRRIHLTRD